MWLALLEWVMTRLTDRTPAGVGLLGAWQERPAA